MNCTAGDFHPSDLKIAFRPEAVLSLSSKQMAKCPKCGKRKAKRPCAALGISLCSLCCGRLREKEIDCPPECPFLEKHKSYQTKREAEQKTDFSPLPISSQEDILRDEKMAWLALHIEAPLNAVAERDSSFSDREALSALEYAQKKTEKGRGIFLIDGSDTGPSNEIGEMIIQSMNQCRHEKKIILPDDHSVYSEEEKIKCLERIKFSIRYFAQDKIDGRRYIETLLERFAKIRDFSRSNPTVSLK